MTFIQSKNTTLQSRAHRRVSNINKFNSTRICTLELTTTDKNVHIMYNYMTTQCIVLVIIQVKKCNILKTYRKLISDFDQDFISSLGSIVGNVIAHYYKLVFDLFCAYHNLIFCHRTKKFVNTLTSNKRCKRTTSW